MSLPEIAALANSSVFNQVDEHLLNDGVQCMVGSDMIRAVRSLGFRGIVISV